MADSEKRKPQGKAGKTKEAALFLGWQGKEGTKPQTYGSVKPISPSFEFLLRHPSLIPF